MLKIITEYYIRKSCAKYCLDSIEDLDNILRTIVKETRKYDTVSNDAGVLECLLDSYFCAAFIELKNL